MDASAKRPPAPTRVTTSASGILLGDDVEHVVWDWNGTLLDDHGHCLAVTNAMLRAEGLAEIDAARARMLFDFPAKRFYERLGFSLDEGHWERLAATFIAAYDAGVECCALHDRVRDVLAVVARSGRRSSILSAARRVSIEPLLERHGIRDFFTEVVGLDDHYAHGKVELGVAWLRSRDVPPSRVVLVGDTVHDFEVAQAMGVRCVLVSAGHHARARLEACACPVVERVAELV